MKKFAFALSLLSAGGMLRAADTPAERLSDATKVFSEIMSTPDKGIPQDLLEKAHCMVIVPDLKKGAFIVGAKYGKGVYIYNALAFYRQLPEGVAGAYRIFANMISLPKNPQR